MLTPEEISEKTFNKTFGVGYRMDDVDEYLKQVSSSMAKMKNINEELERKLEVLADKLTEYRSDEESLRTALLGAQKLGDSVIRESKTKAEIIMRDATFKAEAMVNNAKRQIEKEQDGLIAIQQEVGSFKGRLLDLYKQHLEMISTLPGKMPEETENDEKDNSAAITAEPEVPAEQNSDIPSNEAVQNELFEEGEKQISFPGNLNMNTQDDDEEDDDDIYENNRHEESKFGELRFGESFKISREKDKPRFNK